MTIELTNEEKKNVLESHLKNVLYNAYNAELSLLEENAKTVPNEDNVKSFSDRLNEANNQIKALNEELNKLN